MSARHWTLSDNTLVVVAARSYDRTIFAAQKQQEPMQFRVDNANDGNYRCTICGI
jgi:hypothetical protein